VKRGQHHLTEWDKTESQWGSRAAYAPWEGKGGGSNRGGQISYQKYASKASDIPNKSALRKGKRQHVQGWLKRKKERSPSLSGGAENTRGASSDFLSNASGEGWRIHVREIARVTPEVKKRVKVVFAHCGERNPNRRWLKKKCGRWEGETVTP